MIWNLNLGTQMFCNIPLKVTLQILAQKNLQKY